MNCEIFKSDVIKLISGNIDKTYREKMINHLENCPCCRKFYDEEKNTFTFLEADIALFNDEKELDRLIKELPKQKNQISLINIIFKLISISAESIVSSRLAIVAVFFMILNISIFSGIKSNGINYVNISKYYFEDMQNLYLTFSSNTAAVNSFSIFTSGVAFFIFIFYILSDLLLYIYDAVIKKEGSLPVLI